MSTALLSQAPVLAQSPVLAQFMGDPAQATGSAEFWVFLFIGALSLGSALAMVLMRNPVHAALMLVINFFTIAVFYAVLEAQFLAAVQIIVYAGAIMVLFLFVLMLIGVAKEPRFSGGRLRGQAPVAILLGLALLLALGTGVATPYMTEASGCTPDAQQTAVEAGTDARPCLGLAQANAEGNTEGIGALLFTRYVWPFEVTSILLVIAAIGAMVIGKKKEDPGDLVDRLAVTTPSTAPEPAADDSPTDDSSPEDAASDETATDETGPMTEPVGGATAAGADERSTS